MFCWPAESARAAVCQGTRQVAYQAQPPQRDSGEATLPLPLLRPLGDVPPVAETGRFLTSTGGMVVAEATAALAVQDVSTYEQQLATLFPLSADYYPGDSLRRLGVLRAQDWLNRINNPHNANAHGRQLVALAMVAWRAEQDSLAKALIDARLAELTNRPAEQSTTLAAAIVLFGDTTQDRARLARNVSVVDAYFKRLLALPARGYASRNDSEAVAQRRWRAMSARLHVADALGDPDLLLAQLEPFLTMASALTYDDRMALIGDGFPYVAVASALVRTANGRSRLDSLKTWLLQLTRRRDDEWPARIPVANRPAIAAREAHEMLEHFVPFDMLGQPAPPVLAHAWLNTRDSTYLATPRSHPFNDGMIRVLAFGPRSDSTLPVLDRIQRHFPAGVQVVFVTETEGHGGPDLLSPADEVAWLTQFYRHVRHVTIPIAVWAGQKAPQEAALPPVPVGQPAAGRSTDSPGTTSASDQVIVNFQRYLPVPSPTRSAYRLLTHEGEWVIIDGTGAIRGYQLVKTRAQEAVLVRRLSALLHDASTGLPTSAR